MLETLHRYIISIANFLCKQYLLIKEEISKLLFDFLYPLLSPAITRHGCYVFCESIALLISTVFFIKIIILIHKGIGKLIVNSGEGADFLLKSFIHRVFSSIAWIFTTIAGGVKRLLFGK